MPVQVQAPTAVGGAAVSNHTLWITAAEYEKGKAFLRMSSLAAEQGKTEAFDYVSLHLLCQGIEIYLKALLLRKDFDRYWPRLRQLGHNLTEIARETAAAYGRKPPSGRVAEELAALARGYGLHQFRYAGPTDIFGAPESIERRNVKRYLVALVTGVERSLVAQVAGRAANKKGA